MIAGRVHQLTHFIWPIQTKKYFVAQTGFSGALARPRAIRCHGKGAALRIGNIEREEGVARIVSGGYTAKHGMSLKTVEEWLIVPISTQILVCRFIFRSCMIFQIVCVI